MPENERSDTAEFCKKSRISLTVGSLFYLLAFVLLYYKYVPQIRSVQLIMLSIILYLAVSTSHSIRVGTLSIIILIPLTNSLSNFYHLSAFCPLLFFFYAYVLGILVHQILHPIPINMKNPFVLPVIGASAVLVLSLLFTFWRYTNFFPLYLSSVFDFAVNVLNVTAGEAIRRVLLDFLNYLAGFIWFALLINVLKTKEVIQKAILCLGLSTGISFLFGFIQAFWNPGLGNTEFWIFKNQINALFTDPNALGVYLVLAIPLFAGAYLTFDKTWKPLFALIVLGGIFLIPHSGSRSGFLGIVVVFILFILFSVKIIFGLQKIKPQLFKKVLLVSALSILVLVAILTMLFSTRDSVLSRRIIQNMEVLTQSNSLDIILHGRQQFWDSSRHMIKEFPVSGTGIGTYTVELPNYYLEHAIVPIMTSSYYRNVRPAGVQVDTAGNFYLQVASELGIAGLFFYVWIFFLILKMIVSANFRKNSGSEWRSLKTGLSLGIFAMLLIFIFGVHTLSFEIQLTFWLCVGLLAAVSSDRMFKHKQGNVSKIVVFGIVIIFVSFHAWNTFHDLSIQARTKKLRLQQTFGFYPTERSEQRGAFRWSTQTAGIPVTVKKPILTIPILASHPDIAENPVRLEVSLTKDLFKSQRLLKEIVFNRAEWQNVVIDLKEDTGEDVLLVFDVNRMWNPQKDSGTLDSRDLGIAVGTMTFDEEAQSQTKITDVTTEPLLTFEQKDWQGRQRESLKRTGKSWIDMNLPPGRYRFKLWAQGQKAGLEWPYMVVWVDDEMAGETWVASDVMAPYTFYKTLKKRSQRFAAAFMNDYYERLPNMDRNLILGDLEIFKID